MIRNTRSARILTLSAGATACLVGTFTTVGYMGSSHASASKATAMTISSTASPIQGALPVEISAGTQSDPIHAGPGFHFETLDGKTSGTSTESVAVVKGKTTVGYVDAPSLLGSHKNIVQASWKLSKDTLILDAKSISPTQGHLQSWSSYTPIDATADNNSMTTQNFGYVGIAPGYIYDPKRGSLHDYCTKSPDSFGSANFRGPCSYHDECYDSINHRHLSGGAKYSAMRSCNNKLRSDLNTNCDHAYGTFDPRKYACHEAANVYWDVVTDNTAWTALKEHI